MFEIGEGCKFEHPARSRICSTHVLARKRESWLIGEETRGVRECLVVLLVAAEDLSDYVRGKVQLPRLDVAVQRERPQKEKTLVGIAARNNAFHHILEFNLR